MTRKGGGALSSGASGQQTRHKVLRDLTGPNLAQKLTLTNPTPNLQSCFNCEKHKRVSLSSRLELHTHTNLSLYLNRLDLSLENQRGQ